MASDIFDIEQKYSRFKDAFSLYSYNIESFSKKEKEKIIKALLMKAIEIIYQAIESDNKNFFRKNKDLLFLVRILINALPKLSRLERKIVFETLKAYKIYSVLKVQGMK
jgi:phosphoribosyl-ATP pyrophosphohydrolase